MPTLRSKHGPPPAVVADRIRAERTRLGLSRSQAADRLGIALNSYKQYEVSANPQLSTLSALVGVLGMDVRAIAPELFAGPPHRSRKDPARARTGD